MNTMHIITGWTNRTRTDTILQDRSAEAAQNEYTIGLELNGVECRAA
jgi:hypothetical protein